MTRRLWLALRYPDEQHPLYAKLVVVRSATVSWLLWLGVVLFAPILLIPALPFTATAYGLVWTVHISQSLCQLRATGRYSVLSTTPNGELGISFAVCTGLMHHNRRFLRLHSGSLWSARILVGFIFLSIIFDSLPSIGEAERPLAGVMVYLFVACGLIIDHYQTVAICGLWSMLVPTFVDDAFSIRVIAPAGFLMIQVATYILIVVLSFSVLPAFLRVLQIALPIAARVPLQFVLFVAIRELMVFGLWRVLLHRLRTNWDEAEPLLDWRSHLLV